MDIILYKTKSPNNAINKVLKYKTIKSIKWKDDFSIINPVVTLNGTISMYDFNYCYLPSIKRYYFINNIIQFPNKIYKLYLECDVLESFKHDILESQCFISQQLENNPFYDDNSYKNEMKKEVNTYYSNTEILLENTQLLVTLGG